jgi:hypothetical protein
MAAFLDKACPLHATALYYTDATSICYCQSASIFFLVMSGMWVTSELELVD